VQQLGKKGLVLSVLQAMHLFFSMK